MKIKDIFTLVGSKLKIRKLRTATTIITASLLFGVIIAVLLSAKGLSNVLVEYSRATFGDNTILLVDYQTGGLDTPETRDEAIRLYNNSTDENKAYPVIIPEDNNFNFDPYLDNNNPFAIAAITALKDRQNQASKNVITELAEQYRGEVIDTMDYYRIAGDTLTIEGFMSADEYGMLGSNMGDSVAIVHEDLLGPLIKVGERKDDVIQIVVKLDQAADILRISRPSSRERNPARLQAYVDEVNEQAIGHQFSGTITLDEQESEVTYEIVGLLPASEMLGIDDYSINPFEIALRSLGSSDYAPYSFVITNPDSAAFKNAYNLNANNYSSRVAVSFSDIEEAEAFDKKYNCAHKNGCQDIIISEFVSNQLDIRNVFDGLDRFIVAFVVIFTIVAVIIMAGTVSRVVDDERSSIALYRAVGATTKNILQVFSSYVLMLSLLVVLCSTIIGFIISVVLSALNAGQISAVISNLYNIPGASIGMIVGFDPRVLLIYFAIVVVGLICLLLVSDKLVSKNLVKDLRG